MRRSKPSRPKSSLIRGQTINYEKWARGDLNPGPPPLREPNPRPVRAAS